MTKPQAGSGEQAAQLFRALMHPARLELLELLREGEACVCHLEVLMNRRQAYISQQLSVLREAGLVADRREGANIFYQVAQPEVFALLELAHEMVGGKPVPTPPPVLADCSCPKCAPVRQVGT